MGEDENLDPFSSIMNGSIITDNILGNLQHYTYLCTYFAFNCAWELTVYDFIARYSGHELVEADLIQGNFAISDDTRRHILRLLMCNIAPTRADGIVRNISMSHRAIHHQETSITDIIKERG